MNLQFPAYLKELLGVDTPEINASPQVEKDRAIAAYDYLYNLILIPILIDDSS
ncbi:MAG: hypothetical protein OXG97_05820 [Candidatus Poribacteria bacterium]|nr:hypothetical protein [Candidatus Poribacteria bacterium]